MVTVVEDAGGDIHSVPGSNGRSLAILCGVIERACLEGYPVTVNTAGTGVVQYFGRQMGEFAVNESRVGQCVADVDAGFPSTDFRSLGVGEVFRCQVRLFGFNCAVIDNVACGFQRQLAVGGGVAGVVEVLF
ncbi:hypothetical protein [Photorhabdus temperata]|uniref:hypothetical protein n=1 Tax=Photorhabdus temperata TaxID=574560 RepID=UPI0013E3DB61|nr:hypothetical protein [Photorhabdus temperata]